MSAGVPARSHFHFSIPACCASALFRNVTDRRINKRTDKQNDIAIA